MLAHAVAVVCLALAPAEGGPANPSASARARDALAYIASLPARTEKKILSGQFTSYGPGASPRQVELAHEATGEWPAMVGLDYADFGTGGLHTAAVNRVAIEYARAGGLVMISVHLPNPANPKGGGLRDRGVDMAALLDPATETHGRWMAQLDTMAAGLAELRDAGVVVLWRPFHEMNGGWFWWGAQDPEAFKRVWIHMFEYFSRDKGLDNLLWVYGPNQGQKVAAYYPGDAHTDLVGLDAYSDFVDPEHIKGYDDMMRLGKPFGFTEFGPHGSQRPPGDYDYTRLLAGIQRHFPAACFFLSWHDRWGLGSNRNTKELLASPPIANRDDLPPGLAAAAAPPAP